RHNAEDPLALGSLEAPVTIVMFSDFQCSFCALWNEETFPMINEYIDADQVRIEWRDLAIFGEDSARAAHGAYAAGMQGKYVEFSAHMFEGGTIPNPSELSDAGLEQAAQTIGLDLEKFNHDRASQHVEQQVTQGFE